MPYNTCSCTPYTVQYSHWIFGVYAFTLLFIENYVSLWIRIRIAVRYSSLLFIPQPHPFQHISSKCEKVMRLYTKVIINISLMKSLMFWVLFHIKLCINSSNRWMLFVQCSKCFWGVCVCACFFLVLLSVCFEIYTVGKYGRSWGEGWKWPRWVANWL